MAKSVTIRGMGVLTKRLQRLANGRALDAAFAEVSQRCRRWVADWYRRKGVDWFDTPGSPTHGSGRVDTDWAHDFMLRRSWSVQRRSSRSMASFTIAFAGSSEKERQFLTLADGAVITPKRAAALTIPVIPQAHGLNVAEYARKFHKRVFRPKGKDYLAVDNFGRLRVVYVLRRSVRIKPMRQRNGHEPRAWNDARFKPYVLGQMDKAIGRMLDGRK